MKRHSATPAGESPAWPFAGRVQDVSKVVQRLQNGAPGVLLTGPAGIGKSRLASAVVAELSKSGWSSEVVRGTSSTQGVPYGALAHLLPAAMPAEVINPVRWAADQLAPRRRQRRALLVDDVQQLDSASAAVLAHLVEHRDIVVVATARTDGAISDAVAALSLPEIDRVDVGPLSDEDTTHILRIALGGEVERGSAERLNRLAEGNALLLRELVLAARESEALTGPPWRLVSTVPIKTPVLIELVNARLGTLGDLDADVLEYVALAEPLPSVCLEKLCSADAIENCERRGLITVSGPAAASQVTLTHPIYGEVMRSSGRAWSLRRRYQALVEVVGESPDRYREALRLAVWRLEAGMPQTADALTTAGRIAWAAHDYTQATRLATAAFEAGAGIEAAILLGTLLNYAGQTEKAATVLAAVDAAQPMSPRQLTDYTLTRAGALAVSPSGLSEAMAELAAAKQQLEDVSLRQNLEVFEINLVSYTGDMNRVLTMSKALLDAPPATPELMAQAQMFFATAAGMGGRTLDARDAARAALDKVDLWRDAVPVIVVPLHMVWANSALVAGDLDSAEEALDSLSRQTGGRLGWTMADNALSIGRGHLLALRGQFKDAAAVLARIQPGMAARGGLAQLAQVLALTGDTDGALKALERARLIQDPPLMAGEAEATSLAEACVSAVGGQADAAVEQTIATAERLIGYGMVAVGASALHAVVLFGGAARVVDRIAELAPTVQGPMPGLIHDHAKAAACNDGATLLRVADDFAGLGFLPLAADAAAQAAAAFSASLGGTSTEARRAAARSAQILQQCQQYDSPAVRRLTAPSLSDRERHIARLAAAGRTSAEIADELVLSIRTVENHLQHVYTKLGISGRDELTGLV